MFRFEWEKFRQQRLVYWIVTVVMLVTYLHCAFSGLELLGGWSQEYYWDNPEYRQWHRSHPAERADTDWVQKTLAEYRGFVDANRRSDEEVKAFMDDWYNEEWRAMGYPTPEYSDVIANPYDFEYAMEILSDEAYHSREQERFTTLFRVFIPMAQDPVGHVQDMLARYSGDDSYTPEQHADQDRLAERIFADFTPVVGDSYGWDVLICVGQQLPYSLGLVLVVVLSSLFAGERSANMRPMLRSTKRGRGSLLHTKLAFAWLVTTVLWLLFQISMLITVALSYGLHGAEVTVLHWAGYPTPYGLSNLEYYLIQSAFSYFGTLVQGLLICLLSSVFSARMALPVGLVITLITGFPNTSFAYADKCFTPWQMVTALTPGQMMGAFTTVQIYQSCSFGLLIIPLPCLTVLALLTEAVIMLCLLRKREGGR